MVKQITSFNLQNLKDLKGDYLIDVRTPEEWNIFGKPDGEAFGMKTYFVSYQFYKNNSVILNPNFEKEINNLNLKKSKKFFFICRSGLRSEITANIFERKGFNTYNVLDGFYVDNLTPSWKFNKLPIKKC